MKRKIFEAKGGLLKSLAIDTKLLTADLLAQVMAGPQITAHADIDSRILSLLIAATDENRGLRVHSCASRALRAAGWLFDPYMGPGATHIAQSDGRSYIMHLTTSFVAKEEVTR